MDYRVNIDPFRYDLRKAVKELEVLSNEFSILKNEREHRKNEGGATDYLEERIKDILNERASLFNIITYVEYIRRNYMPDGRIVN